VGSRERSGIGIEAIEKRNGIGDRDGDQDEDQDEIGNEIKTGFKAEIEAGATRIRDGIGDEDGIWFPLRIQDRGQRFGIQVDMAMLRSC
jgi:hypothetical protein